METFITLLHVLITEIMLYKLVTKVERKHLTLLVCLIGELISYKLVTKVELKHLTLFFSFFFTRFNFCNHFVQVMKVEGKRLPLLQVLMSEEQ